MTGLVVRKAGLDEMETLLAWRMEVLREVFSLPPDEDLGELERANRAYYREALEAGGHIACFAVREEIVGCGGVCLYREMPSPDNPNGMCAYLMNVYTRPGSRGQGVGEAVVRWLVDQARRRGATKIYLETSESGRGLYRKLGFAPMEDYLALGPARPPCGPSPSCGINDGVNTT